MCAGHATEWENRLATMPRGYRQTTRPDDGGSPLRSTDVREAYCSALQAGGARHHSIPAGLVDSVSEHFIAHPISNANAFEIREQVTRMAQCIERGMFEAGGIAGRETRMQQGTGVVLALLRSGEFGVAVDGKLLATGSNSDMRRLYRDWGKAAGRLNVLPNVSGAPAAQGADWTRAEVELLVADYVEMLRMHLSGQPFVKAHRYRNLAQLIGRRSQKSIEFKHANVSAVLRDLGLIWIPGITPRSNYQSLLAEVVFDAVIDEVALLESMRSAVDSPVQTEGLTEELVRLVPAPKGTDEARRDVARLEVLLGRKVPRIDYIEREARNASLGRAGEELIVLSERKRLASVGRSRLADRVEHVAVTQGDGLGYDVRSFNEDGSSRLIEVKTTRGGIEVPFFVTRNELRVSRLEGETYHLFRVFDFGRHAKCYTQQGPLDAKFVLEPTHYIARP